jgi:hypothetical protein
MMNRLGWYTDDAWKEEDMIPEAGLCIYCQKEFLDLHNHVKIFHPGTYASTNIDRQEGNGPDSNTQGRG